MKNTFAYVVVTHAGHCIVLQKRDNMGRVIPFSEGNTQISYVSGNKCMEIDKGLMQGYVRRKKHSRGDCRNMH
jgi:hypothetical protein